MRFILHEDEIEYRNVNYDFADDLDIVKSILGLSNEELSNLCDCDSKEFDAIENGLLPRKETTDKFYGFAYSQGIYINDIIWQEYQDEYENENYLILSHGSRSGLKGRIRLDVNSENNDFANGFYCGESLKQAGMFVSDSPESSSYIIGFDRRKLKPFKFFVSTKWMIAVSYYRDKLGEYENHPFVKKLIDKVNEADYIIAPIADNQIFEIIDAFASGELTDKQAKFAMAATHLGMQYVFKKDRCIDNLTVLRRCYLSPMEKTDFVNDSNKEWRTSISKAILAKKKFRNNGKYISEILN